MGQRILLGVVCIASLIAVVLWGTERAEYRPLEPVSAGRSSTVLVVPSGDSIPESPDAEPTRFEQRLQENREENRAQLIRLKGQLERDAVRISTERDLLNRVLRQPILGEEGIARSDD